MASFADRWSPSLDLLVNPEDPREAIDATGGDARGTLAAMMPPRDALTDDDWSHLVTGKPHPSQVAGEKVTPSDSAKLDDSDWEHLVTGKPAPPKTSTPPEPPPEPDLSGGFGIVGKGFKKAPVATAAIGAPLALGTAIPLVGAAGMGYAALPLWAQIIGGYYGLPYAARKIGDIAGAPQTGEYAGRLMDLVSQAGHAMTP